MGSIISVIISIISKLLPSLLDWIVKQSKQPDKEILDDKPAPKPVRDWMANKIRNHPGYQKTLNSNNKDDKNV